MTSAIERLSYAFGTVAAVASVLYYMTGNDFDLLSWAGVEKVAAYFGSSDAHEGGTRALLAVQQTTVVTVDKLSGAEWVQIGVFALFFLSLVFLALARMFSDRRQRLRHAH